MVSSLLNIPGYQVSEQLYNGSRTLVYRGYREADSLPVVIKLLKNSYPSFGELLSFRNQYTIAKNLNSPLIIQTYSLEAYQNGYALVMEDFAGISLKEWIFKEGNAASLMDFLQIAIAMSNTLHILYRHRILHKDIKPANILINPETKQVKLIDFSIASLLPRETQSLVNPNVLEGTLAYISPEQTGRMNRAIDYRTDFYSLGVTFYELLTGELPFESNDPMELVHCHIAKIPTALSNRKKGIGNRQEIPPVLCEIIIKLMAKNPENRYQSALGLSFDLEKCLHQLKETGEIQSFQIGEMDVCDRFIVPDKLYGRETEIETLLQAFERVSLSATEMMLVAGLSGIGKTAVINEIHKPIVRQRGYFIKGKFEQFQRNIPLGAFVQAFRDLIGQLLTENDAQIQQWKSKILEAVGDNGQVIIEVIPELSRIIGEQTPAAELSGTAAQNRFNLLFQKFIQVFTTAKHPLVIFLDDLQWADSTSLNLIQLLMADTGYLLLIGAYRDNEVNPAHPLMLTLSEIKKTAATINTITLAPLNQCQVNKLVAETLKCSENLALPLSTLIFHKTKGNPFFATQFLKALYQDELIKFNLEAGCWECDIAQVNQQTVTDDVVTFMAFQLRRLPESTQRILQLAACIGNQFDLATLAIVSEQSQIDTASDLWKALQSGLILPISDVYKFYHGDDNKLTLANENTSQELAKYIFLHDRVQQAAYSLIPEDRKQATHLKIGQLLLQNIAKNEQEKQIFTIVNQLNVGATLIHSQVQRDELAQLNFLAGRKAKTATAYGSAIEYFSTGCQLLARDCWQTNYIMTLALFESAAEAAYLNGNFEQMNQWIDVVLQNANSFLDKLNIYNINIQALTAQNKLQDAVSTGLEVLKNLGIDFANYPEQADLEQAIEEIKTRLSGWEIEQLINLPEMTDPGQLAAMQIISTTIAPAYVGAPNLLPLLVLKQVNLSLQFGNTELSAYAYVMYGLILCGVLGNIELGYQFGQLATLLLEKFEDQQFECRILNIFNAFICHWKKPLQTTIKCLAKGYQIGIDRGDIEFVGYCALNDGINSFWSGQELTEVEGKIGNYSQAIAQFNQQTTYTYLKIYWQLVLNLLAANENPCELNGVAYQEATMLPVHQQANDAYALAQLYLAKLVIHYLFCEFSQAIATAELGQTYIGALVGNAAVPIFPFYDSLARLALWNEMTPSEQENMLELVAANQQKMKHWANHAPANYLQKFYLVEAELCRILGKRAEAVDLYDRAISLAKENAYIQEEALSNELAAKFYLHWGKEIVAQEYMYQAYYCYARWGAKAKTNDLEKRYPQLLKLIQQQRQINLNPLETFVFHGTSSSTHTSSSGTTNISDILDFTSVLKAAQAISSSLELDQLLASLTCIILENSGAKKSALILPQNEDTAMGGFPKLKQVSDDIWQVRAITFINEEIDIRTLLKPQSIDTCQDIPAKIIHYVKHTKQTVIIDNCKTDIPGIIGEYMHRIQPQSVLCTPIINQGHLLGILYLENSLTPGVFSSDRLSVINLLCTQAAISLKNAQLYTHLQTSEARFQRLAENAPGIIYQFQLSPDGISRLNYVSPGCYEIYEIPSEQAVAEASSLMSLTHPEDAAHYLESISISAQTLEPWLYEGRIITPSGKVKWIQAASRPIKQTDSTIIWDGLLLDITERKQAEAAVFQKSQELKKALEELQQVQLQIIQSEKMSALGNLVAGVAHEMNNPLGFIAASLQQAQPTFADIVEHLKLYQASVPNPHEEIKDHAEEIDLDYSLEDLPKIIESMMMACDRLKNISTSLRTFSRADKDYKVPFNIHEGIDSTILILKHRLKANEQRPAIEVITEYGNFPPVQCFPGQLNQVFMNILANAIDAFDELNSGRSFAEIQVNPNKITIKTSTENNHVKIAIADNAQGMTEEVKQKIFNHLFTTKAVGKGTGLGLAIARQIIESTHGGKLICNSLLGKGTEFIIEISL